MCAPLVKGEGQAFGVIQVDTQDRSKKFTQDDLNFLVGVANQAATALENAKLHEDQVAKERFQHELELARRVQQGFLPQQLPEMAGYEFFGHYESAQLVGGDYYDFVPLPSGRIAILLGDVAGKGMPAALLMAKLSADARYCMLTEAHPAAAVTKLNNLLLRADLMDRFVTLAVAVLDPITHVVTLVNAGHLMPLVFRKESEALADAMSADVSGVPLGVLEGFEYASGTVELSVGESLLLFTDGVPDAPNAAGQQFQLKGIQAAISSQSALETDPLRPAGLGQRIVQAVKRHSLGCPPHDDIAMVCFGRVASPDDEASQTAKHKPVVVRSTEANPEAISR
jgi:serine phosphatase RsbU (regulator of sigma subunit)